MINKLFNESTCQTCGKESNGYHSCPYQEEICDNNDDEHCNCCGECQSECVWDI